MGSSNQYTIKVIIIFCLAFFFSRPSKSSADTLPDANDISRPAKEAKQAADMFMRESFELRLQFEYSGKEEPQGQNRRLRGRRLGRKVRLDRSLAKTLCRVVRNQS